MVGILDVVVVLVWFWLVVVRLEWFDWFIYWLGCESVVRVVFEVDLVGWWERLGEVRIWWKV